MGNELLSVGLDVGTTSTQLVISSLKIENKAGPFAVPDLAISDRKILYKSPVHFTPLIDESRVNTPELRRLLEEEYRRAGIRPDQVDTGAVIITGETSRKENARAVLEEISHLAGDFVVATAGPDLESVLAAKGSGAAVWSERKGKTVLHMDIGGGTSNLALIRNGKIQATGCLNVGGRLIKLDSSGKLTYISPVLKDCFPFSPGQCPTKDALCALAEILTKALEMAAGLRQADSLLSQLITREAAPWHIPQEQVILSFSGGVAECIRQDYPDTAFGDLGPILGRAIRRSLLCADRYLLEEDSIRATVIGAGCHSTQLSGSTVFCQNISLPLKNLPVLRIPEQEQPQELRQKLARQEGLAVIAMEGYASPGYKQIRELAQRIAQAADGPLILCLERDMAKALGQALAACLGPDRPILCLDGIRLGADDYLDVGASVGPALRVVVKTLILER